MVFNVLGLIVVYALQRLQGLPLNPQGLGAVTADSSWNTAVSFCQQHELAGLRRRSHDELSFPDGRAGCAEFCLCRHRHGSADRHPRDRPAYRHRTRRSFWVDLTRTTLYILLPLSLLVALALVSQGVVQTFSRTQTTAWL